VRQTRALGAGVWMLRGVVRTELQGPGFTSGPAATSGIGLRLVEAGSGRVLAQTPYLNVTRDWTPLEARAVVSPAAQLVRIEVVRPASPESALRMTGTAWLDDVTLVREASK